MASSLKIDNDFPPFFMRREGGNLAPRDQYNYERLLTFSEDRDIKVYLVQEPNSRLIRQWWAVIGLAVKQCKTPWSNQIAASDALKIELGHVRGIKLSNGRRVGIPRSLNELSDVDMRDLRDRAFVVLEHITGVDPMTLKKEAGDVGDDHEPAKQVDENNSDAGTAEIKEVDENTEKSIEQDTSDKSTNEDGKQKTQAKGESEAIRADVIHYARYLCTMLTNFKEDGTISDVEGCLAQINAAWKTANDKNNGGIFIKASENLVKKGKSVTGWAHDVINGEKQLSAYKNRVSELLNCSISELNKKEA